MFEDIPLKVILIGDTGVGKTSIMNRFVDEKFDDRPFTTIGIDFKSKIVNLNEDNKVILDKKQITKHIIKLKIWDTAGSEKYKSLSNIYYRGSDGVFIVYDTNDLDYKDKVNQYINDVKEMLNDPVIFIIGNKYENNTIRDVFEDYPVYLVSAKNGVNTEAIFHRMIESIISKDNGLKLMTRKLPIYTKTDSCCSM
jgi:small GTP-binding protein